MPSKPLEPGDPLRLGRFELLGRLGEGGQGIVYLGRGTNREKSGHVGVRATVDANVLERLACVNTLTRTGTTATVLTFSEPQKANCVRRQ